MVSIALLLNKIHFLIDLAEKLGLCALCEQVATWIIYEISAANPLPAALLPFTLVS
jgi:hypothetical protein